jgi:hypothetical protein
LSIYFECTHYAHLVGVYCQAVLDTAKEEQTHPFRWSLKLYRNPPVMAPQDLRVSEEELALVEDKLMDAARKRLAGLNAVRIEKILEGLDPGDFVIIAAPDDVEEPFYVAQVIPCVCFVCVSLCYWLKHFYFLVLNTVRSYTMISTMIK